MACGVLARACVVVGPHNGRRTEAQAPDHRVARAFSSLRVREVAVTCGSHLASCYGLWQGSSPTTSS